MSIRSRKYNLASAYAAVGLDIVPQLICSLTLADLEGRLRKVAEFYPGQPVVLRADRETSYSSLMSVIDTCRNAGVWNFSLATVQDKGSN